MENKLKVYYDGCPDNKFEDELSQFLAKFGYKFCASGFNTVTLKRDLEYEKR